MQIIGAKKGQQASKPYIMPDNMQSGNEVGIVYGLGEGEILGLVDGGKSIYLDGTPLINDNGGENFGGVIWEMRHGTIDQTHLHGFPAVENETGVNVELRHDRPFVRQIRNTKLSAVVIRLGFGAIFIAKDNGDRVGHTIEYAVDVQTDGGVWHEVLATKFTGKASQGYKRSHRIDLPTAKSNWTIRVRRLTANEDSEMVGDRMTIDALTEVLDAKLRYPCTALIGLRFNAESFNNIPKFAAECHGMIIQVPSNYDPVGRTYLGLWDGTFKLAYSNNPAWIYYDLCTARRYALGDRLIGHLDKWSLYRVAQYCDEMVDDGRGGREPRYACNVYLQQCEDAYKILQNIAGIFHALTYWDSEQIIVDADLPKDVLYTFSRANIIGDFEYSGTANYARHTQIKVAWDDPDNEYKTTYEIVPDLQAIAKYGVKTLDMSAFGCTSQAQAIRLGKWALLSEALETQTVTFSVGLDGYLPHVGSVIAVSDHVLAGRDNGGRVQAIDGNIITLDRSVTKPLASGDMLMINGSDGVTETRPITAINGNKITVQTAFERAEVDAVWAMDSTDLQTLKLRVMSIVQSEPAKFTITGVEYNPDKFAAAEIDIRALPKPVSVIPTAVISAPETVTISQSVRVEQGVSITKLSIDWSQVIGAVAYIVKWRKDDGNWQTLPKVSGQSVDIDGVYAGSYMAQVQAIDAFDNESLATSSQLTQIAGKTGRPPRLARLNVQGKLFGMDLAWTFNKGSDDTNFTEIQVSPDGRSNIAILGTFAYPTNKHEITGLQGNLTQHYRARIVDKLGNTSDWTDWVSGTTDAQADKVLDLISGQISQSHLDQSLRTPIAKIGGIESGLNGLKGQIPSLQSAINGQLPTLNTKIATAERHLQTAQNTLQTAVANIATERNRISSAIRDISALQSANNAKTQEIANLTQTMNGHTSSIRELGVTTGDLTQKYSQLKTASDTANSEITAIKQTQAGQASNIDRLGARFDNLAVGGRNLLLNTKTLHPLWTLPTSIDNGVATFVGTGGLLVSTQQSDNIQALENGKVAISFTAKSNRDGRLHIRLRRFNTNNQLSDVAQYITIDSREFKRYSLTLDYKKWTNQERVNFEIATYERAGFVCEVKLPKLEIGTIPTDWTPAPEDLQAGIDSKASTANLETLRQTLTDADTALGQRISAIDTAYKQADTATNAKLANAEKAISDNNTALSQQITALDTAYKSADNYLMAHLAREETARANGDSANAQAIRTVESTVQGVSGRVGTAESKIATLERTTSDLNGAIATAQNQLNARFDNLAVGGRNLLKNSNPSVANANYMHRFELTNAPSVGDEVVVTLWGDMGADRTGIGMYNTQGYTELFKLTEIADGVYQGKGQWRLPMNGSTPRTPNDTHLNVYFYPSSATSQNRIDRIKLEKGTIPTDWTPAPEDLQAGIDSKASTATLDEFKRTQAQKDTATASQISQLTASVSTAQQTANTANGKADTANSKADSAQSTANNALTRANTANSAVTAEQKARTDADSSLASQITALNTAYKQADSQLSGRITTAQNTATNAQNAVATARTELNARFDSLAVGGRNLILGSRVSRNTHGTTALSVSQNIDFGNITHLVLSCDVRFANAQRATTRGAKWFRIGAEIRLVWTDGTSNWYGAWRSNVANNVSFDGRVVHKITIPTGKTLRAIDSTKIQVWDITGENMLVKNPKLELGTIPTDWTPAPEDLQVDLSPYATNASLDEFKRTQATKDTATTQKLSQLESGLGTKANATALNNYYTKAQTDQAIGGRVERFEASLKRQELNAVTDLNTLTTQGQYFIKAGNNPNAPATNWLFVDVETSNDQWIIVQTIRQDNNAKNQWVRQRHNGNWSAWEKVATGSELNDKASASALNELNTRVTQVDGKITTEANKVSQLQTTLNGQTTSIRNVEQSVNGVRAIKAVTVDNNGFISGYGLMSELQNGRVTSRFGINADQIYFGGTTSAKKPFVLNTRPTTIDGVHYPAGAWFNTAHIASASITNAHLADATITSAKIANGSIDNAKIANGSIDNAKIANGAITSAKIGTAQIGTLQIAGESVTVPRAQSFDDARPNLLGEIFNMSMDAQGGSILVSAYFNVNCTLTRSSRGNGYASVTSSMEKKLKISIKCNGSVVTEKIFTFKDIRESTATDNSSSGNRPVTATATSFVYDKPMAIINHVHRNPPSPANYTISIEHVSGDGDHTVMNGSSLLLGVKR